MKLLDPVQQMLRVKHYTYRTEQCYLRWIDPFIRFHKRPGPQPPVARPAT